MRENLWLRAIAEASDKELGGEMKSVRETYFKSSLENFQKSLPFKEIYVKYLEKNSIQE